MPLHLFDRQINIKEELLHSKFLLLKDKDFFAQQKEILINWTEGLADRDNKIIKEFQTTFHSSFWEFYLFAFFKERGFQFNQLHERPDFMITEPFKINVEAVVANIKNKGRPESDRGFEDIISGLTPPFLQPDYNYFMDEAIVRYASAMNAKKEKYKKEYSNCDWVEQNVPFVVALASYDQVNYGREFLYPIVALLYGYYYIPQEDRFLKKNEINKPGSGVDIAINLFSKTEYEDIAAVIFSCAITLGKLTALAISEKADSHNSKQKVFNIRCDIGGFPKYKIQTVSPESPETLSDGLFVLHNPNAKNKIPKEVFASPRATQIFNENEQLYFEGEQMPIFLRLNLPSILCHNGLNILIADTLHNLNEHALFYKNR